MAQGISSGVTTYTYDNVGNLQNFAYPNGGKSGTDGSDPNYSVLFVESGVRLAGNENGVTPVCPRISVGADFWESAGLGFLKGAAIGAATFGLGSIALKAAAPLLRATFEPIFAAVGNLERITLVGQSGLDETLVRISRFFLNTNKRYPAVGETPVGRILQKLFPEVEWEMHHIFVQQAWSRGGSAFQIFESVEANEGLRRIGNGLWNLIPVPGALNLFLRSPVAAGVFATIYYGAIAYGGYYFYSAVFE